MTLRSVIALCVSLVLHIVLFAGGYVLFKEEDRVAKLSTQTKTVVLAMNLVKPTPDAPSAPIVAPPKPPEPIKPPEPVKKPPVEKKPEPPKPKKKPKKPKPKKKPIKKKTPPKKKVTPKPVEPTPPPVEYVEPAPVVTAPPAPVVPAPTPTATPSPSTTSAPYSPKPVPPDATVGNQPQTAGVRSLSGTVTYRFVIGGVSGSGQVGGQRLNCTKQPAYPKKAQRRNAEGTVKISFKADGSGRIIKAKIVKASHPFLRDRKLLKHLKRNCKVPN